jgi:hypothetical protein
MIAKAVSKIFKTDFSVTVPQWHRFLALTSIEIKAAAPIIHQES